MSSGLRSCVPRREAARRANELSSSLEVGDEVVTIGGLYGTIVSIDDREVELDVAEGVTLRFARRAIAGKAPADVDDEDGLEDDDEEYEDDDLEDDGELGERRTRPRTTSTLTRRRMKSRSSRPHRMPTNHPVVDALD